MGREWYDNADSFHTDSIHTRCVINCHPDQATFTDVAAVQQAHDNNATAVAEVDFWVAPPFGERFFNSCKVGASHISCGSLVLNSDHHAI